MITSSKHFLWRFDKKCVIIEKNTSIINFIKRYEVIAMGVSYKKLWMLIIEKDLKKSEVREMAKISASTFSKMAKNEYVSLDVLIRLCIALECEISDIVEIIR